MPTLALLVILALAGAAPQAPTPKPPASAPSPIEPPRPAEKATSAPGPALDAEQIAERAMPGVVTIVCESVTDGVQGSGFFVRPGVIATNFHVVRGMIRGGIVPTTDPPTVIDPSRRPVWFRPPMCQGLPRPNPR